MNFITKIHSLISGLFYGMKTTEDIVLKQSGASHQLEGTTIQQKVEDKRVSKALLRGELTQEVEELRYRTYNVDREAKNYEYYTPILAMRRDKMDTKFVKYWNDDNLEVITIQPNEISDDGINSIDADDEGVYKGYELFKNKHNYSIKLTRGDFTPRYYIEEYISRVVVRRIDDEYSMLDLYISKYPNDKDFKSKGLIREIEKIKNERLRSDIIDINTLSFITNHAFKYDNMFEFEFDNLRLAYVNEYDGFYVISFKSRNVKQGNDLMKKYYSKSMDDKYKTNAKKEIILNPFDITDNSKVYKCEHCGKEIKYDTDEIDYMPIFQPRDIFDEEQCNKISPTEYLDAQICEQTFGVVLCHDCLKKYIENNKKQK